MQILHIDAGAEMRGGQHQVLLLLKGLRTRGIPPHLLARRGSPLFRAASSEGIDVSPLSWWSLWRASRRCDLVHCHDARAHTMAWLASRAPFVVSRRVAFPLKRSRISSRKYAAPQLFLSISEAVSRELTDAGIPRDRIALVPDGVELPLVLSSRKGPVVALDSNDPAKGRGLLARTGLSIEFVTDLPRALESARLFLYATECEGLGSAALLAMAAGVPVIASDVGGLREIVHDGETGLLVENDEQAFAAATLRLDEDECLAERLSANARALIEKNYTADRMVERTLACYWLVLD